ncbi:MAG: hypothetical protein H0T75_04580 [Rhizobiales bacterium]|nr:hypothetical protein [Hyphomicrobiales bacterium]
MNAKDDGLTAGVQRLNALLGWWGVPMAGGNGTIDRRMKRFQQFASDLQSACGDAYGGQMDVLCASNDRIARSFQDLLRSRQPQEAMAAELGILATFLESASRQARGWAELTEKLQTCCVAVAQDAAEDLRRRAPETAPTPEIGEPDQSAAQKTRRQLAPA